MTDTLIYTTFTQACECGLTRSFVDGAEVPHTHAEITPQMVRDAWVSGYDWARSECAA